MKVLNPEKVRTLTVLNVGCGNDVPDDMINLDIHPLNGVDVVADATSETLPFRQGQFTHVRLWAILEHIPNWERVLENLRPYCADGCVFDIDVPYYNSANAAGSYEHVRFFSMTSFHNYVGFQNRIAGKTLWELKSITDVPTLVGRFIPRIPMAGTNLRVLISYHIGHVIGGVKSVIVVRK